MKFTVKEIKQIFNNKDIEQKIYDLVIKRQFFNKDNKITQIMNEIHLYLGSPPEHIFYQMKIILEEKIIEVKLKNEKNFKENLYQKYSKKMIKPLQNLKNHNKILINSISEKLANFYGETLGRNCFKEKFSNESIKVFLGGIESYLVVDISEKINKKIKVIDNYTDIVTSRYKDITMNEIKKKIFQDEQNSMMKKLNLMKKLGNFKITFIYNKKMLKLKEIIEGEYKNLKHYKYEQLEGKKASVEKIKMDFISSIIEYENKNEIIRQIKINKDKIKMFIFCFDCKEEENVKELINICRGLVTTKKLFLVCNYNDNNINDKNDNTNDNNNDNDNNNNNNNNNNDYNNENNNEKFSIIENFINEEQKDIKILKYEEKKKLNIFKMIFEEQRNGEGKIIDKDMEKFSNLLNNNKSCLFTFDNFIDFLNNRTLPGENLNKGICEEIFKPIFNNFEKRGIVNIGKLANCYDEGLKKVEKLIEIREEKNEEYQRIKNEQISLLEAEKSKRILSENGCFFKNAQVIFDIKNIKNMCLVKADKINEGKNVRILIRAQLNKENSDEYNAKIFINNEMKIIDLLNINNFPVKVFSIDEKNEFKIYVRENNELFAESVAFVEIGKILELDAIGKIITEKINLESSFLKEETNKENADFQKEKNSEKEFDNKEKEEEENNNEKEDNNKSEEDNNKNKEKDFKNDKENNKNERENNKNEEEEEKKEKENEKEIEENRKKGEEDKKKEEEGEEDKKNEEEGEEYKRKEEEKDNEKEKEENNNEDKKKEEEQEDDKKEENNKNEKKEEENKGDKNENEEVEDKQKEKDIKEKEEDDKKEENDENTKKEENFLKEKEEVEKNIKKDNNGAEEIKNEENNDEGGAGNDEEEEENEEKTDEVGKIIERKKGKKVGEIEVKLKIILEKEEELQLRIDRTEQIIQNNKSYISSLFKFKYDLKGIINDSNAIDVIKKSNNYLDKLEESLNANPQEAKRLMNESIDEEKEIINMEKNKREKEINEEQKKLKNLEKEEIKVRNELKSLENKKKKLLKQISEVNKEMDKIENKDNEIPEIINNEENPEEGGAGDFEDNENNNEENKNESNNNNNVNNSNENNNNNNNSENNNNTNENNIKEDLNYKKLKEKKENFEFEYNETINLATKVNREHVALKKRLINNEEKILSLRKDMEEVMNLAIQRRDRKKQISDFFIAQTKFSDENIKKLRDYFAYVQKGVLKFYERALIIETDLFQMKNKNAGIASGVSALAGSVPFIGGVLKSVAKVAFDQHRKWTEKKVVKKSMKFVTLIPNADVLNEILEEMAFRLVKNPEKVSFIVKTEGEKSGFFDKIKKTFDSFMDKMFSEKKKEDKKKKKKDNKKNEDEDKKESNSVLKDIDNAAKMMANIDSTFICSQAALEINEEFEFNPKDIYNKIPLTNLFFNIAKNVKQEAYDNVLNFDMQKEVPKIELDSKKIDKDIGEFNLNKKENIVDCLKNIEERDFSKEIIEEEFEDNNTMNRVRELKQKELDIMDKICKLEDMQLDNLTRIKKNERGLGKVETGLHEFNYYFDHMEDVSNNLCNYNEKLINSEYNFEKIKGDTKKKLFAVSAFRDVEEDKKKKIEELKSKSVLAPIKAKNTYLRAIKALQKK